ncbi:serine O-acetyltransferase [Peredibacter starrii]|uniref:Serine acetyltransferase n=1 Tax=Peredibacter starrii TaxID=28202 RepID=A0AAX4HL12_9BACT|nr:serine acetyltransferase [Peredibacter starrii]WPU63958.1 serine acetyltransferase [Peredibacter starrii]
MSSKLAQFLHRDRLQTATIVMNVQEVRQSVDQLVCLLFPQRGCLGRQSLESTEKSVEELKARFKSYFEAVAGLGIKKSAEEIAEAFFEKIPGLAEILDSDAHAALMGDPAAYSREEVIITYPGFYAVCIHRLAHAIHELGVPLIPRLMSEYAHEKTGIDIHPGAKIAGSFFIDHGTGVVIGETTTIGKNVKIYQGVTLGALSVKKKLQSLKRHPTIEDDVVIYASATILGGETVIGKGSIIGGNTWLVSSVAPGSIISLGNQ